MVGRMSPSSSATELLLLSSYRKRYFLQSLPFLDHVARLSLWPPDFPESVIKGCDSEINSQVK